MYMCIVRWRQRQEEKEAQEKCRSNSPGFPRGPGPPGNPVAPGTPGNDCPGGPGRPW